MKIQLTILGADRYSVDGSKGGKIYTLDDNTVMEADKVGRNVIAMKCDYDFIDQLKQHAQLMPALFECEGRMVQGSKKNATFEITAVTPLNKK